ncbi:MAG TPA: SDR family NAD(P)-dependent oxidoreductase [Candidatus Baltobacteraceae bacterium]|nr:SDR family NAD(P)-dependent oxidoreductase [Candidatus Baltobacteraceae bacterium]
MNFSLEGKNAVVTGGAQGLGQAICGALAKAGCNVAIADMKEEAAQTTATEISKATGRKAFAMKTDVTQEADVEKLFDRTVKEFDGVDIVVANAAILIAEPIAEANAEKWRAVMNVNLFGNFLTMKHACRVMKPQKRGVIIQINSKSGKKGSAANSAYAATKFGGIGLVQSVALEMAPHGIRCNAICPGNLLDSPLWTDANNGLFVQYLKAGKVPGAKNIEDVKQFYTNQVPMKRGCSYDDICATLIFLASDAASYLTGISMSVTGGQEMN